MDIALIDWWSYAPELLDAAVRTLEYTIVSFVGAVILGIAVAVMRGSRWILVRGVARTYTEIVKNLPLLTAIFIVYFGLTSVNIVLDAFTAGCISLLFFYGAYLAEIFRGSLMSVGRGQREAAQAAGLSGGVGMRTVVLPQAIRVALPGAGTMLVDLLKSTSLLVTIAGAELMSVGQAITSETFAALQVYIGLGLIYFALCFPLSQGVAALERLSTGGVPILPSRRRLHRRLQRYLGPDIRRGARAHG
jgi:His/Glu/Gln/Arg/opine family amino acid ABC transporter permease subunit